MNESSAQASGYVLHRLMAAYHVSDFDELAYTMGVPPATVRTWRKRGGVPSKYCERAAIETGVMLDWLILGRFDDGSGRPVQFDHISSLVTQEEQQFLPENFHKKTIPAGDEIILLKKYDAVGSCGNGSWIDRAKVIELVPYSRAWLMREGLSPEHTVIIGSAGDSMAPLIAPGSSLLVDRSKTDATMGGIFAFVYHGELIIKRLTITQEGLYVTSENSAGYPARIFAGDEADSIKIEGRVFIAVRRV